MKIINIKILIPLIVILLVSGCADSVTLQQAINVEPVGFWYGVWHGVTFTFAFFGQLVWDDIAIYAIYNNGGWYDFGFWIGACTVSGCVKHYNKGFV